VAPFADNPAIEAAPLPALVAVAGVGWLIVRYRTAIIDWSRATLGERAGSLVGRAFVGIGGYGWLLIGLLGVIFWVFDQADNNPRGR
jgi:hypothetical protein